MNTAERALAVATLLAKPGVLPQNVIVASGAADVPSKDGRRCGLAINLLIRTDTLSLPELWLLTAGLALKLRRARLLRGFVALMIWLMVEEGDVDQVRVMRFSTTCSSVLRLLQGVGPDALLEESILDGQVKCYWFHEKVRTRLLAQRTRP